VTSITNNDPTKVERSCRTLRYWEAPASLAAEGPKSRRFVDVLHSGSRIVFSSTRRSVGQNVLPAYGSQPLTGHGPTRLPGGRTGFEPARPWTPPRQSSVYPVVSRRPTRVWSETLRCSAIELQRHARASGAGGTRTHNPRLLRHVLQPAVGRFLQSVQKRPTKSLSRPIASWLDVVPAGSWASNKDPPTRRKVQTGHLNRM